MPPSEIDGKCCVQHDKSNCHQAYRYRDTDSDVFVIHEFVESSIWRSPGLGLRYIIPPESTFGLAGRSHAATASAHDTLDPQVPALLPAMGRRFIAYPMTATASTAA